ncbi:MAG: aldo/keto reductase [Proteobacteria bacterium]|nr:aldo/keto reductase [Pseudomonadota bacterium]
MPLDHFVTLGRSGLRVSPLCLGTMTFGQDWGWGSSVEDSQRILDRYLDRGGNFIDTANMYTKGHSEKIIGDHLGRTARRDRTVIATKFSGNLFRHDPNGGGANRKAIVQQCEASLRRLQTDYIDLYWMHCWDRFTPIEETMRALDDLVASGKVRYVGVSDTPAWKVAQAQVLAELRGWTQFVGLQIEYSLLQRTVEGELMPMAAELGLGVTPWSPLAGGVLTGKFKRGGPGSERGDFTNAYLTDRAFDILDVLVDVAKQLDSTPARVALKWVQSQPGVTSTIIGARRLEQLDDNLACLDLELPAQAREALQSATAPSLPFPCDFLNMMPGFFGNGAHINGLQTDVFGISPEGDADRY